MISSIYKDEAHHFRVWAPEKDEVQLHVVFPFDQYYRMQKDNEGYFSAVVPTPEKVLRYFFKPEGKRDVPDPASPFQPEGVHGPSQTVDHALYAWRDKDWKGLPLEELILYEIHVGLFTPEGTFESIIPRLDDLKETGINALELMPVCSFPGSRNWGYDGVYPYAVQNSYGGPDGLKMLVDACHQRGIAVFLDVVYNHLGPEGNYFSQFAPYFTDTYHTPWGDAINFDGPWSDGVREFFSDNPVYWFRHYHIDGLRCDAIHALYDNGAVHFWELVQQKKKLFENETGRTFHLIAESDLNSPKVVRLPEEGGYGFDAQWLDDFHHALYVLLNPADNERYYDFGSIDQLAKAYKDGFVHSGEWVKFRKRKHGRSSAGVPGYHFVIFNQNHDQAGNRIDGRRLCSLVNTERVKLAAAAIFLSPYIPMLFMGEEYADESPFFYFVSHSDTALIKAVQEGRRKEFKDFGFDQPPPDPQEEETFLRCKLQWEKRNSAPHQNILNWHRQLIRMRRSLKALKNFRKEHLDVRVLGASAFSLLRQSSDEKERLLCLFNLSEKPIRYDPAFHGAKLLDSQEEGTGRQDKDVHPRALYAHKKIEILPVSVVVYELFAPEQLRQ